MEVVSMSEEDCIYKINNCLCNMTESFILLGGYLDDAKLFCRTVFNVDKGRVCKNVYEWAEMRFGFKKSTTASLIGVCLRFGDRKQFIKEDFKEYNYSQLVELLSVEDAILPWFSPDMTIKQMRELKCEKTVQTSGQKIDYKENKDIERFLILKNDAERLDFLRNYSSWGLWYEDSNINVKYYRCMFSNGDYLIASVPIPYYNSYNRFITPGPNYKIIKDCTNKQDSHYNFCFDSETSILSFMKQNKLKIIPDYWGDKRQEQLKQEKEMQRLDAEALKKSKQTKKRKAINAINKEMHYINVMNGGKQNV